LHELVGHSSWAGVYLDEGGELVLGPWQGPAATEHVRIPVGQWSVAPQQRAAGRGSSTTSTMTLAPSCAFSLDSSEIASRFISAVPSSAR
jgi:hypothetical protein